MSGISELFSGIGEFFDMIWNLIKSVLQALRFIWQSVYLTLDTVGTASLVLPAVLGGILLVSLIIIIVFRVLLR